MPVKQPDADMPSFWAEITITFLQLLKNDAKIHNYNSDTDICYGVTVAVQ